MSKKVSSRTPQVLIPTPPVPKRIIFHGQPPVGERLNDSPRSSTSAPRRIFLISPADTSGTRAQRILNGNSQSQVAQQLRGEGAPLHDVFTFMSSLYFRGKVLYARKFANPPDGLPGILVITPSRGLLLPEAKITIAEMEGISAVRAHHTNPDFRDPLERDARKLSHQTGPDVEFVLLGSIATLKYVEPLAKVFGSRLRFPSDFLGRGNMSRGGLLLSCVRENRELLYNPVTDDLLRKPKAKKNATGT